MSRPNPYTSTLHPERGMTVANSFQDLSQVLAQVKNTFPPQVLSASGNGQSIDVTSVGSDRINAILNVGDAVALTSLDVKLQSSPDGTTWTDILDVNGDVVAFTQVTTDGGATGLVPQVVAFQLMPPATAATAASQYVRAVATLVGTSVAICVGLLAARKYDQLNTYNNAPGYNGNNVIN